MSDALVRCYLILYWVLPLPLTSVKGRTLITEVITESNQATQHNTDKRLSNQAAVSEHIVLH